MRVINEKFSHLFSLEEERALVEALCNAGFLSWHEEPICFRSSSMSHAYVGGREDLTDNPMALKMLALAVARIARDMKAGDPRELCFIGIPVAGTTLAQAAASVINARFRVMRKEKKKYGNHRERIDGTANASRDWYMIVDNTISNGGTRMEAIEHLEQENYPIGELGHIVGADRGIGAIERLRDQGHNIEALFTVLGLARAFVTLDLWPSRRIAILEDENKTMRLG